MADYVRTRGQDDEFYAKLLTDDLSGTGHASRKDVEDLLLSKLSDALTPEQKSKKVANLLTKMRRQGRIYNAGSNKGSQWRLANKMQDKSRSLQNKSGRSDANSPFFSFLQHAKISTQSYKCRKNSVRP